MKKILIAAVILSTAVLSSYTKQVPVKTNANILIEPSLALVKKDIGTAD
ncbi:hypothetical protein ACFQZI_05350 [Mucilaginibacter lutimaris]|uniref:Uncharacterized protein n=1 Tax=Mucilaginibacter lutimaris TaxID=931629 RepID=A0ABW2ZDJ5_9SPHI